ncbi:hypothetical protein HY989_04640 [Candidatus Micrarchaeota archaeon]|nr:hypothetical protein [Candidatus Micrarchaeota archaeon]
MAKYNRYWISQNTGQKEPELMKGSTRNLVHRVIENISDFRRVKLEPFSYARQNGKTLLQFIHYPKTRHIEIEYLGFDSKLRNAESMRRSKRMLGQMEELARKLKVGEIKTNEAVFNKRMAKRHGYDFVRSEGKFNFYSKKI